MGTVAMFSPLKFVPPMATTLSSRISRLAALMASSAFALTS